MEFGEPAIPVKTNPAPGATMIRERPLLLFQAELAVADFPIWIFLVVVPSLDAASNPKCAASPATAVALPIVICTCELPPEGQLPVLLLAIVTEPGVDEPVTTQCVASEAV